MRVVSPKSNFGGTHPLPCPSVLTPMGKLDQSNISYKNSSTDVNKNTSVANISPVHWVVIKIFVIELCN